MNREEGWAIADVSTSLMADPKVVALSRILRDSERTGAAVALYQATVLNSWREGTRVTIDAAQPAWWTDPAGDLIEALIAANLIDGTARTVPLRTWKSWYFPAAKRRRAIRRKSALGGLRNRGTVSLDAAVAELDRLDAEWLEHLEQLEPEWTAGYLEATPIGDTSQVTHPSLPSLPLPVLGSKDPSPTTTRRGRGPWAVPIDLPTPERAGEIAAAIRANFAHPPKEPTQ